MRTPKPMPKGAEESLKRLMQKTKTKSDYQRVMAVWLRASLKVSASQIATALGWSTSSVHRIHSKYFQQGESALLGVGRGGRRRQNLSLEQEESMLSTFFQRAQSGGVLVVSEIKSTYEELVGHPVHKSTVYRMLKRHGWRKIAPRPRHPKMDKDKQEAFKKNSRYY
jgi:transposase